MGGVETIYGRNPKQGLAVQPEQDGWYKIEDINPGENITIPNPEFWGEYKVAREDGTVLVNITLGKHGNWLTFRRSIKE